MRREKGMHRLLPYLPATHPVSKPPPPSYKKHRYKPKAHLLWDIQEESEPISRSNSLCQQDLKKISIHITPSDPCCSISSGDAVIKKIPFRDCTNQSQGSDDIRPPPEKIKREERDIPKFATSEENLSQPLPNCGPVLNAYLKSLETETKEMLDVTCHTSQRLCSLSQDKEDCNS